MKRNQVSWAIDKVRGSIKVLLWIIISVLLCLVCCYLFDGWAYLLYARSRLFGESMIPSLCDDLGTTDKFTRMIATNELARFGEPAVPCLASALIASSAGKKAAAAKALYLLACLHPTSLDQIRAKCNANLEVALQDLDPMVRVQAARADWRINAKADRVLPVFLDAISNQDIEVCYIGFTGIIEMGSLAKAAMPEIKARLHDKNPDIRQWAVEAREAVDLSKEPAKRE